MTISPAELSKLIPLIQDAGALLLRRFEARHFPDPGDEAGARAEGERRMKAPHEFVLEEDLMADKLLAEGIAWRFPDAGIYSEEMADWRRFREDKRLKFLIDPLDGTHNYHYGLPQWGIAVSLLDADNRPLAGFIHIPRYDLLLYNFTAGKGPTHENYGGRTRVITSSPRHQFSEALVAYDNQFYRLGEAAFARYQEIAKRAFTTRITGSAAFDAAMVALGKFDARIWNQVEPYDVAAAFPIIQGAGGVTCGLDGNADIDIFHGGMMVVGNREFANELAQAIR
ncbi:inositol monophosphatase family protein [Magnetofaba australis]|uniref:Putative inositol-phosphate phosphatase n=1 Tax=Magnetofaba australis IT-1 TaxID=1434232 RepID=A0A1Y2K383_9PROT|nr:inositol monophosphatase [Magnetofaba australis]OSM02510.1 putative inositol-phosphate phosphatase [Magnetofaba australis IT-1]